MVFATYELSIQNVGAWFPEHFGFLSVSGVVSGVFGWSGFEVQVYCNAGPTLFSNPEKHSSFIC